jgi:hypothetical protein
MAGIAGVDDIDTLTMARSSFKLGAKNATTGKRLTSYSLSKLADWMGIDTSQI